MQQLAAPCGAMSAVGDEMRLTADALTTDRRQLYTPARDITLTLRPAIALPVRARKSGARVPHRLNQRQESLNRRSSERLCAKSADGAVAIVVRSANLVAVAANTDARASAALSD
jgi:hypothetical protein